MDRKFPSSPHSGSALRSQGAEAFVLAHPLWGNAPIYIVQEFVVGVPTGGNVEIARITADADLVVFGFMLALENFNESFQSPVTMLVNAAIVPLPAQQLPMAVPGNGLQDMFPLQLFLKKNDTLTCEARNWTEMPGQITRTGDLVFRAWTVG